MKIAILTIATNNYKILLKSLISSINNNFLNKYQKDVFVFSDEDEFSNIYPNARFIKINHEKWPFITLKRFEYFNSISKELSEYDYIFYFDSDLEVIKNVNDFEFHPLFGVQHPASFFMDPFWDIETNNKSTAFLDPNNPWIYHQGCLWGGKSKEIIKMNEVLYNNIQMDFSNSIVAKWHDESHLNNYFYNNREKVLTISSSYCYPENWSLPCEKIIIHKDKNMDEYPRFQGIKQ